MITFDNFYSLDSKKRSAIINDPEELIKLVKHNVSLDRYNHSLSVAKLAVSLAKVHKVDLKKAYYAGILHDVCKDLSEEELNNYLYYYDKSLLNEPLGVKHSHVAKYYLKDKLNYHDKDVLNAIYNHTICESNSKLSLILYIADKREELRNIDDNIVEHAYQNLYQAYLELENDVKEYISKNG